MKGTLLPLLIFVFVLSPLLFACASDGLNEEQAQFVKRMEAFQDAMEAKVFGTIGRLNGSRDVETRNFEVETATHLVKVARGAVVEKGGFMRTVVKKALPPMMGEPLLNRYMQIDIYPKTPLVGMLHIAMNFVYFKDGTNHVGGLLNIIPGTIIEEDLSSVKAELDELFAKRGVDIDPFREPLLKGPHKQRLKDSCVGVSFYGRGNAEPPLEINEKNFGLVKDSCEIFFDAYVKLLEKRKDQKFGEKDVEAMFDMRRRWLEKEFLWDPFPSKGLVPYEVWSFQDLPPEVRF
jgi:coproporphyrinogen III oxidase